MVFLDESPQLQYAPWPAGAGIKKLYRWIIVASVALSLYLCRSWPMASWQHFRLLYLKYECDQHPIPAGTVVYSSNAPVTAIVSPEWAAFAAEDPTGFFWTGNPNVATVFIGELRASNGIRRLVEVEAHPNWKPNGFSDVMFSIRSVGLNVSTPLQENTQPGGGPTCNADPRWQRTLPDIVVTSASVDGADPSHIRFDCRVFQEDYVVDGHLGIDGRFTLDKWSGTSLPMNTHTR